jgi:hypothetical protein
LPRFNAFVGNQRFAIGKRFGTDVRHSGGSRVDAVFGNVKKLERQSDLFFSR